MPELPEVETVRRTLAPLLVGRTITGVDVLFPGAVVGVEPSQLTAVLSGQRLVGLGRRGKFLIGELAPGPYSLLFHLRMTGRLVWTAPEAPLSPYARLLFWLGPQSLPAAEPAAAPGTATAQAGRLDFADVRKFGRCYLLQEAELRSLLGRLGPEPLGAGFHAEGLARALAGRVAPVKAILLDQGCVAGLGNIYADEALYRAGIDPRTPAGQLTPQEVIRLHAAIREILAESIALGGTTLRDYVDGWGRSGRYQTMLAVYGREGEPCRRCGTPVVRERVAGRGTHFCPQCQGPVGGGGANRRAHQPAGGRPGCSASG